MHCARQAFTGQRGWPGFIGSAPNAHLCDDHQVLRVGMEGFADNFIGDMRAIVIAGVYMVRSELNGLAHHGHGGLAVCGGPKAMGPVSCMAPYPMRLSAILAPLAPPDLALHALIIGPAGQSSEGWSFRKDGKATSIRVRGRLVIDAAEAATAAARGLGNPFHRAGKRPVRA